MKKPWAGRFRHKTAGIVDSFSESISFDKRLWKHDINGSIAHAKMLGRQGIIHQKDSAAIVKGLTDIAAEIKTGKFKFKKELEDIHMNIEAALINKIGAAGKKLHTARSRNDQISLDFRLYLKEETEEIILAINTLQKTILKISERYLNAVMPGYTHLQRAQPVLLSHHLLAYVEMLQRDKNRFNDSIKRIDVLPLGSCAISGTTMPIDRKFTAKALGFKSISGNSIDAVSDRDFAIEFLSCSSILMMHLSRLSEELILWATIEFGFVEISDDFSTGSSLMPQKKNPDIAELIRGKTGRVYGSLLSLLTVLKGLPLSYNRDLQEDKLPVFDTSDTIKSCLEILNQMLPKIKFNTERMRSTSGKGYSTATDLAEYLVKKRMPFRETHEITGKIVLYCIKKNIDLQSLSLKELKTFSPIISKDVFRILDPAESVKARTSYGGTSPSEVKRQIRLFKKLIK